MPSLHVQSTTDDLANLDSTRLLKAVVAVLLQEINTLRAKAGLSPITADEARRAVVKAYKNG